MLYLASEDNREIPLSLLCLLRQNSKPYLMPLLFGVLAFLYACEKIGTVDYLLAPRPTSYHDREIKFNSNFPPHSKNMKHYLWKLPTTPHTHTYIFHPEGINKKSHLHVPGMHFSCFDISAHYLAWSSGIVPPPPLP